MRASSVPFDAVVIGCSSGGVELLGSLLRELPANFPAPIIVCQHAAPGMTAGLVDLFGESAALPVLEAEEKVPALPGRVYFAPGGYHLLIERDGSFSLSMDPPVRYARPSIDVLFETAAAAYENRLVAIILSGASEDGAAGVKAVRQAGGYVVVQTPESATAPVMPAAALAAVRADAMVTPEQLAPLLARLFEPRAES